MSVIHCADGGRGGVGLRATNHFPVSKKTLQNNLFATQQASHCHWVPLLNWMVHRLLNYFYIPVFHARLKAYYWRDWDHRNLLHVWPFKAFHHDGSQVRIYWNQFLSEILMLAHQPSPVWNIHFLKKAKSGKERGSPLTTGNGQHFKAPQMPLCSFHPN